MYRCVYGGAYSGNYYTPVDAKMPVQRIYFSMFILDIFQTLKNGATTYIISHIYFSFPIKLLHYIAEHKINMLYWVPSALCLVANLKALGRVDISCVKKFLFVGEEMPTKQLNM